MGYPLGMQIAQAEKIGVVVAVPAFFADAIACRWSPERAIRHIREELRMIGRIDDAELVVAALRKRAAAI